jgi:hypothetical protein
VLLRVCVNHLLNVAFDKGWKKTIAEPHVSLRSNKIPEKRQSTVKRERGVFAFQRDTVDDFVEMIIMAVLGGETLHDELR